MSKTLPKKMLGIARAFTVATVAASTIGLSAAPSLALTLRSTSTTTRALPTATQSSSPTMSCGVAQQVAKAYIAAGDAMMATNNAGAAAGFYGKAEGVLEAACGH